MSSRHCWGVVDYVHVRTFWRSFDIGWRENIRVHTFIIHLKFRKPNLNKNERVEILSKILEITIRHRVITIQLRSATSSSEIKFTNLGSSHVDSRFELTVSFEMLRKWPEQHLTPRMLTHIIDLQSRMCSSNTSRIISPWYPTRIQSNQRRYTSDVWSSLKVVVVTNSSLTYDQLHLNCQMRDQS